MELQYLCTNCLTGTLQNGTCSYCRKRAEEVAAKRPVNALRERYMLGNQYYLGRVIGNGGFGITYLAWDCIEQRRVIVKELYPKNDVQRDPMTGRIFPLKGQEDYFAHLKKRFHSEAQILYSFRNEPSILNVYRLIEDNNTVYYSMEYLTGLDLRSYMKQMGKLSWDQVSDYVKALLRTLRVLHGSGLIHRDISPDNIFLISTTQAKLIDFGSVRAYNNERGLTTILKQVYAPIEQYFTNGNQGPWTDIYALSVTLYHVLSDVRPPKATDRVNNDNAIPIGQLCSNLPGHVANAITKGMAVRAENRFSSIDEMAGALFPNENIFPVQAQKAESGTSQRSQRARQPVSYMLHIKEGIYQGYRLEILPGCGFSFGREQSCSISYPPDSPGISRKQCSLWCDEYGRLWVRDDQSSYGTKASFIEYDYEYGFIGEKEKKVLRGGDWYPLEYPITSHRPTEKGDPGGHWEISFAGERFEIHQI